MLTLANKFRTNAVLHSWYWRLRVLSQSWGANLWKQCEANKYPGLNDSLFLQTDLVPGGCHAPCAEALPGVYARLKDNVGREEDEKASRDDTCKISNRNSQILLIGPVLSILIAAVQSRSLGPKFHDTNPDLQCIGDLAWTQMLIEWMNKQCAKLKPELTHQSIIGVMLKSVVSCFWHEVRKCESSLPGRLHGCGSPSIVCIGIIDYPKLDTFPFLPFLPWTRDSPSPPDFRSYLTERH